MQITQSVNPRRTRLWRDAAVLGLLLLIYRLTARLLSYVFHYVAYAVVSGKVSLVWKDIINYFSEHSSLYYSTSFQMAANISVSACAVIITLLIARLCFRVSVKSFIKVDKNAAKTGLRWMPSCFVFNMISSTIIGFLTAFLSRAGVTVPTADFSIRQPSALAVIAQFAYIIVLAPLFEELIYRGLVIKMLASHNKTAAVLVSALAFGLMHGNIPQAASAFCTGIIYAIIALKFGTILPTVIIHSLNNLVVNSNELLSAMNIKNAYGFISAIEICIALFGFFVWFTDYKFMKYDDSPDSEAKTAAFRGVMLNPMIVVYLSILVISIILGIIRAN